MTKRKTITLPEPHQGMLDAFATASAESAKLDAIESAIKTLPAQWKSLESEVRDLTRTRDEEEAKVLYGSEPGDAAKVEVLEQTIAQKQAEIARLKRQDDFLDPAGTAACADLVAASKLLRTEMGTYRKAVMGAASERVRELAGELAELHALVEAFGRATAYLDPWLDRADISDPATPGGSGGNLLKERGDRTDATVAACGETLDLLRKVSAMCPTRDRRFDGVRAIRTRAAIFGAR